MLPPHIPHSIRVFSFQYNTSLNGAATNLGIRQHADDLLVRLADDREDDEAAALRPIIFVGHSLGGMIIKRVYIYFFQPPHRKFFALLTLIPTYKALKRARDYRDSGTDDTSEPPGLDAVATPRQGTKTNGCSGRNGPRRYRLIWEATRGVVSG